MSKDRRNIMQRYLKLCLLISVFTMLFTAAFANTIQIGDGTDTQNTVPMRVSYDYSWTRSVYTRSELAGANVPDIGGISAISYEVVSTEQSYTLTNQYIYMAHTNATNAGLSVTAPDGF